MRQSQTRAHHPHDRGPTPSHMSVHTCRHRIPPRATAVIAIVPLLLVLTACASKPARDAATATRYIPPSESAQLLNAFEADGATPAIRFSDRFNANIDEFIEHATVTRDFFECNSLVIDIKSRLGDTGDLYDGYTEPLLVQMFAAGLIPANFTPGPGALAAARVVAPFPIGKGKGEAFDVLLMSVGNALDIRSGRLPRTDLFQNAAAPMAMVPYASLNDDPGVLADAELIPRDQWDSVLDGIALPEGLIAVYPDGSYHQPKLWRVPNGAVVRRELPANLTNRRTVTLHFRRGGINIEIASAMRLDLVRQTNLALEDVVLKDAANEDERRLSDQRLVINVPAQVTDDLATFVRKLKDMSFNCAPAEKPLVIVDSIEEAIRFVGPARIRFQELYAETRAGVPLIIAPRRNMEAIDRRYLEQEYPNREDWPREPGGLLPVGAELFVIANPGGQTGEETQYIFKNDLADVTRALRDIFGYSPADLKYFLQRAVQLRAVAAFFFERYPRRIVDQSGLIAYDVKDDCFYVGTMRVDAKVELARRDVSIDGVVRQADYWTLRPHAGGWNRENLRELRLLNLLDGARFEVLVPDTVEEEVRNEHGEVVEVIRREVPRYELRELRLTPWAMPKAPDGADDWRGELWDSIFITRIDQIMEESPTNAAARRNLINELDAYYEDDSLARYRQLLRAQLAQIIE